MALFRNPLERAMARASRDPGEHEEAFFAALLASTLVLPVPPVRLDRKGRERFAVFSSHAALREHARDADANTEDVPASEAFQRALGSGLPTVLNLDGDPHYKLSEDEVRALAHALLPGSPSLRPMTLPSGHRLVVVAPEENPLSLKRALLAVLPSLPEVARAFLVAVADEHSPRLFLGLELTTDEASGMEAVVAVLDPVLQDALGFDERIDVAMLNATPVLAACESVGPAFYRRVVS